ncbi:MAG: hypothetical protein WB424_11470, partial [Terracidiphilus sp.]
MLLAQETMLKLSSSSTSLQAMVLGTLAIGVGWGRWLHSIHGPNALDLLRQNWIKITFGLLILGIFIVFSNPNDIVQIPKCPDWLVSFLSSPVSRGYSTI